jgi:hypothetical protein
MEGPTTLLVLTTGDKLEVAGEPEDVGRILQDAVRSSSGTLAWLDDADGNGVVGVNPAHVVMVTAPPRLPPSSGSVAG